MCKKVLNFIENQVMQTLIVEIDSKTKAKELSDILSSMNFVKKVSSVRKHTEMIAALQEHEDMKAAILKKKNKAIAKYL
jgi:cell division protein FtsX